MTDRSVWDGPPPPSGFLLTVAQCHAVVAEYYARIGENVCGHDNVFKDVGEDDYGEVLPEVVDTAFELYGGDTVSDDPTVAVADAVVEQLAPYVLEFRHYLQRCPR